MARKDNAACDRISGKQEKAGRIHSTHIHDDGPFFRAHIKYDLVIRKQETTRRPLKKRKKIRKNPTTAREPHLRRNLSSFIIAHLFPACAGSVVSTLGPIAPPRHIPLPMKDRRETKTPASENTKNNPPIYWEKQRDSNCGRHAINMIFGAAVFDEQDLDREAVELENLCNMANVDLRGFPGEHSKDYVPSEKNGNWTADVLLRAINSQPQSFLTGRADREMPPALLFSTCYIGSLIHKATEPTNGAEPGGGHYICFRKVNNQLYLLDSLDSASAKREISLIAAKQLIREPLIHCWHVFEKTQRHFAHIQDALSAKNGKTLDPEKTQTERRAATAPRRKKKNIRCYTPANFHIILTV